MKCIVLMCAVVIVASVQGKLPVGVEHCLESNSVSCLQSVAYRSLRELANQDSIPLVGGLELVRSAGARSINTIPQEEAAAVLDREDASGDVEKREEMLEKFVMETATQFVSERRLRLTVPLDKVAETARAVTSALPEALTSAVGEGRAKKLLKTLIPFFLGMKLKVIGFLMLSYLAIALMAKQAVFASLIALGLAVFTVVRGLIHSARHPTHFTHETHVSATPVHVPSYGAVGLELGDGYSSHHPAAVAHGLAYGAYKPLASRR